MSADHIAEPGVLDAPVIEDGDLTSLIAEYEEAEQTQRPAREKAERDRDYVDNKQLTDDEVQKLQKRGQPPITLNHIRTRAAFLGGMEKKQRRDPKGYPRNNPNDQPAADAFTAAMRYVVDRADYPTQRSAAWKNIVVEGYGALEVAAVEKRSGYEFEIKRIPWDRVFYDPHSSELDFSDSRYFGQVLWMDYDEALKRAVSGGQVDADRAREVLDTTMAQSPGLSQTYDDKPKHMLWADQKRKRVRIVMMWRREVDGWRYVEFTRAGKLIESIAPYVDQDGESYCPWIFESANVDRDNNRYGEMRHLIDPQDEINKRRSKSLHLLSTTGVIADKGAVADVNAARRELAKPDFWLTKNPGTNLEIVRGMELASGQMQMAQQALDYMLQAGPNGALLGKGVNDQSGRAIEAQQAGGLVEQSDLMDTLRRLDLRVFRVVGHMIRQFWTAEKWVRITDDPDSPEYAGLNIKMWMDAETGRVATEQEWRKLYEQTGAIPDLVPAVDETGRPMLQHDVAQMDLDIIYSDAPDTIALGGEDFQAFTQLMAAALPPQMLRLAIEMHPSLSSRRKKQLTEMLDKLSQPQDNPGADEASRLAKERAEADIADTRASAYDKLTRGEERMAKLGMQMPVPDVAAGMTDAPQGPPAGPGGPMPPGMPDAGPGGPPEMMGGSMDAPPQDMPPRPEQGPPVAMVGA